MKWIFLVVGFLAGFLFWPAVGALLRYAFGWLNRDTM